MFFAFQIAEINVHKPQLLAYIFQAAFYVLFLSPTAAYTVSWIISLYIDIGGLKVKIKWQV